MNEATEPTCSSGERRRWLLLLLVVAVWTVEVFLVQRHVYDHGGQHVFEVVGMRAATRLLLDVLCCGVLVVVLNRFWLRMIFVVSTLLSAVLLTYYNYFGHALTLSTIRYQTGEALGFDGSIWSPVSATQIVLLLAALAAKIVLRQFAPKAAPVPLRWRPTLVGGICAALLVLASASYVRSLALLRTIRTTDDVGQMYGFLGAALGEYLFLDQDTLLAKALEAAKTTSDRLTPVETRLEPGRHVAIIQVESLDVAALSAKVDGQLVMPFLAGLKKRCMYYEIRPVHASSSSDADFVMLMNQMPSGIIAPFKIVKYPFHDALPRLTKAAGYSCFALHGNGGNFFRRRPAYEQMGFDGLLFKEELEKTGLPVYEDLIHDDELLQCSAKLLRQAKDPTVHFIITVTSHTPFVFTPPPGDAPFKNPKTEGEYYLNSMRYVDTALARYVDPLPEGTLVVFYADHDSQASYLDHRPSGSNLVPVLIFQKGEDLSKRQKTRASGLATSGELGLLDVAGYVASWFGDHAKTRRREGK